MNGTAIMSPATAYGLTYGNTLSITFTAGTLAWTTGTLKISIPAGWSAPSLDPARPGYFTVDCAGGTITTKAISGQDIILTVVGLPADTGTVTVTYGDRTYGGSGALLDGSGSVSVPVAVDEDGTAVTPIQASPSVFIIPATMTITPTYTPIVGSGSITLTPGIVTSGSAGNVLTFTYTAGSVPWVNGTLRITLPSGWSAPSTSPVAAGYYYVSTTASSWIATGSGGTDLVISVSDLAANTGTITVYYGYKGFGGPGATITGVGTFQLTTMVDESGTDVYPVAISPQIIVIPPTATVTMTHTETYTYTVTPTITETSTITETPTITQTHTVSPTFTMTMTHTVSPTFTVTPTFTPTPTPFWATLGKAVSEQDAEYVSLSVNSDGVFAGYKDIKSGSKGTVLQYSGAAWNAVGAKGFTSGMVYDCNMSSYTYPYFAYRDNNDSDRVKLMKYQSGSWSLVGGAAVSAGAGYYPSLSIDAGSPYVAFSDSTRSGHITVRRFAFTSWIDVGVPGYTTGTASALSLYVHSGTPYVAYQDWANANKISVDKFNGLKWVPVGAQGFSDGAASHISLKCSQAGTPYVAYTDGGNGNKLTVKYYNGTSWTTVGTQGFSQGTASYNSLFFNAADEPSVALADSYYGGKAIVMKYNGAGFSLAAELSDGAAAYVSAGYYGGDPYVAFQDIANGNRLTVMKYEGAY